MFLCVIAVVAVCAIVCGIAWKVAFQDGREAGILHERNTRNEGRLREGRVERASREIWGREPDGFDLGQWAAGLSEDHGERLADTGELQAARDYHPSVRGLGASTDTGAIRALVEGTSAYLRQMAEEEGAYRDGLAS
jgi:hypothetical protein